jgi:hypothetical protein
MKHVTIGLSLVLLMMVPLIAFGQAGDTLLITSPLAAGQYLDGVLSADTAGAGATAWANGTRVYKLQKDGFYPIANPFTIGAGRKLTIVAEQGNYVRGGDMRPEIYGSKDDGTYPGNFFVIGALGGVIRLKDLALTGADELLPALGIDGMQGGLINISSNRSGSVYMDNCVAKTINGQIIRTDGRPFVVKVTNSIFADMGFLGTTNLGAGKGVDLRNQEVDSAIFVNNTFVNVVDRTIRHYQSLYPIHNFIFNNNTVINATSYHGMLSLGWVDTSGTGTFQIKNNLFLDAFAMPPDTDSQRQAEFITNAEMDPINSKAKMTWILATTNTGPNPTPWVIRNNYWAVSDSGEAIRQLGAPYLKVPLATMYPGTAEPILNADMTRQVNAHMGAGSAATAFTKVTAVPQNVPALMSKMIRWYYAPRSAGTPPDNQANVGAGAGRAKLGGSGNGDPFFVHDAVNNVWVYDYDRRPATYYQTDFNASFRASVNLGTAADDGGVVGSRMWSYNGPVGVGSDPTVVPGSYELGQNYPNPFNPTTKITFSLPTETDVTVEVFDVLGRNVATVFRGVMGVGIHAVDFDATHLVSGMYIYRLSGAGVDISKKMMLVK